MARSGLCGGLAELKDRLIRDGHGAFEVMGLLSANAVQVELSHVIARSQASAARPA